jgi:lysylphosphatidylglycerol synthetase-like protein (DUF2156 family)
MLRIKSPQDVGAAATFILIGVAGLWFGREYDLGTASQMGPGYMPMLLSVGLILFGIIVGVRAVTVAGPAFERIRWRSALLILLSILVFALLIETAGLLAATFAVVVLSAVASGEASWKETIGLAVFLAIFCVAVFVYALKQPIPVLWGG